MSTVLTLEHKKTNFSVFEQHRSKLRQLYLEENKSLADVKREMEACHGFPETDTKIYEYGFQQLGFVKKLSIGEWVQVDTRVRKRKEREGKETEVFLSSILQPQDKIKRIISRHKRRKHVQERIARGPTPDLPNYVCLRTPPPPDMMANFSVPNNFHIPRPLTEVRDFNMDTILHFKRTSDAILKRMILDQNATAHMLVDVPSSKMIERLRQKVITGPLVPRYQESCDINTLRPHEDFAPIPNLNTMSVAFQRFGKPTDMSTEETCLRIGGWFCMLAVNGRYSNIGEWDEGIDILTWLMRSANNALLDALFSSPGMERLWSHFIFYRTDLKYRDTYQILAETGLRLYNRGSAWMVNIRAFSLILQWVVNVGSKKAKKLADWLSSLFVSYRDIHGKHLWDIHGKRLWDIRGERLWDMACHLEVEMMSKCVQAGAHFECSWLLTPTGMETLPLIVQLAQTSENRQQWIGLLKMAKFDFDTPIIPGSVSDKVFRHCRCDDDYDYNGCCHYGTNWSILDYMWLSGEHEVYDALVPYSKRAASKITVPGLIKAAQGGVEQLGLYLGKVYPDTGRHSGCRSISQECSLQVGLSTAAAIGNVDAITALGEIRVDPNISLVLFEQREQWHWPPLIRAARGKHFNAFVKLVEMGANLTSDVDGFNPLSAAIYTPRQLSDAKQIEKRRIVRYLISINNSRVREYGADAMVKAVTPPGFAHDLAPDEKVIDMLLEAGVELDKIIVDDMDILHYVISRCCNLRTVEILLSRGAQIHSLPRGNPQVTMLHRATKSNSTDRFRIIKRLIQSGFKWDDLIILDAALPKMREGYPEIRLGSEVFSFLVEESLLNDWPAVAARWPPILTRLLSYGVSDALICQAIEAGADCNAQGWHDGDDSGSIWCSGADYTPLQLAALNGRLDVVRQLLSRGAHINAPAFTDGHTVLQAACYASGFSGIPLGFIEFLLENGADINAPGAVCPSSLQCGTALHCAIKAGSMLVFCYLLDAGANFHATQGENPRSPPGLSSLDLAAAYERLDMVDILLKKGAESEGNTYDGAIQLTRDDSEIALVIKAFAKAKISQQGNK